MSTVLSILGIIGAILLIKYRERVAEFTGAGEWMEWFGGVYNFLIIVAIVIFFFSIASLTGGLSFFLSPLKWLLPSPLGLNPAAGM